MVGAAEKVKARGGAAVKQAARSLESVDIATDARRSQKLSRQILPEATTSHFQCIVARPPTQGISCGVHGSVAGSSARRSQLRRV